MKKLYLLTALLLVTAGNIFAMDMYSDNESETTDRASQVTVLGEQPVILTHAQYNTQIDQAINALEPQWEIAINLMFEWTTVLQNERPRTIQGLINLAGLMNHQQRIAAYAQETGQADQERFHRLAHTAIELRDSYFFPNGYRAADNQRR